MAKVYRLEGDARRLHEQICRALALGEVLRPPMGLDADVETPAPEMLFALSRSIPSRAP